MQTSGIVTRLRKPITRLAAVRISASRQQQRSVSSGSTSSVFSRVTAQKRVEQLKSWKNLAHQAQSLFISLKYQARSLATDSQKSSEFVNASDAETTTGKAQFTEEKTQDRMSESSNVSGSGSTGGSNTSGSSQAAPPPPRQRSLLFLTFIVLSLIVEALVIYSLYLNYVGDDYMQYLAFVPGLQWVPALKIADMSYWWLLFPLLHWPLNRAVSHLFYQKRTLGTFLLMQFSWASVLAFATYHRYNVLDHVDAANFWSAVLMAINPTKMLLWSALSFQGDQFGRTPNFVAKKQAEAERANLQPGQTSVVVVTSQPFSHFYNVSWKRLQEAAAGQRAPVNNPVFSAAAWVSSQIGVGAPNLPEGVETKASQNAPAARK